MGTSVKALEKIILLVREVSVTLKLIVCTFFCGALR
jgi:hypothetical protein